MTRRTVAVLVAASVGVAALAEAQPAAAPPSTPAARYLDEVSGLTLDQAVARALEHEPGLRAARTEVDGARGLRTQAGLRPNPTVSFAQQEEPSGTDSQTRVEVEWPLDLFRKSGRVAVADAEVQVSQQSVADRERLLAADARMKYGELAALVRALEVTDRLVAATRQQFELVGARVNQGATPPLERDMLRVEVQRLESERVLEEGQAERALIELKRLLGLSPEMPLRISETLERLVQREAAWSAATSTSSADQRADVQEAAARIRVAESRVDRSRLDGRVDISLFGMYMRMDAGFPQRGFDAVGNLERVRGQFQYVAAGATVTLPILNRNQGEVAAAQAERAGAAARLEATQLTAQAEVSSARVRDEHARRAAAAYSGETRTLARANLDVVRQTYALGRATVFDVLAEQRRYLEFERGYTSALREAYESRTALRRAVGDVR
jgi:cobalt-zinc-cadmium efflux system outer membrane protein